jgi:hypothetical protein
VLLGLGLWAGQGVAQEPRLVPDDGTPASANTAPQEADITRPYAVVPQAGTWLICAASYMGPNAPALAVQLAEQIRARYKMPAFVFNHANEERRRMREELDKARQAAEQQGIVLPHRRRSIRIEEQCAVLIGGPGAGWSNMDDASSYLKTVRKWPLPELKLDNGMPAYDMVHQYVPVGNTGRAELKATPVNPFTSSFVTRNPSVPPDTQPKSKFDPAWKEFNKEEEYSLLHCPKKYTLVVKEYSGAAVIQPHAQSSSFLDKLGLGGKKMGETITAAGYQAHALAELLDKLGMKPYVLHTRNNSIVTVGAFDSPEDPEMARMQDRLSRFSFVDQRTGTPYNLGLFARPVPMEVPHP